MKHCRIFASLSLIVPALWGCGAGELNGMALTEDGDVMMWGMGGGNDFGLSTTNRYLPIRVPNPAGTGSLSHVVQVAVGQNNAVVLNDDGTVFSWGYYTGQGTDSSKTYPDYVKDPSGSGVLGGIVSISAAGNFTLALGANGKVYGWGWDGNGQTGRGTKVTAEKLPVPVRYQLSSRCLNCCANPRAASQQSANVAQNHHLRFREFQDLKIVCWQFVG
jgi:alpha-tubulin suppressor-like RCC1 family protein